MNAEKEKLAEEYCKREIGDEHELSYGDVHAAFLAGFEAGVEARGELIGWELTAFERAKTTNDELASKLYTIICRLTKIDKSGSTK